MASPEPGEAPGHYNNSHRAFLQAFMARSTLTFYQAKPIVAAVLTAQGMPFQALRGQIK
jgi:hypothetical protein